MLGLSIKKSVAVGFSVGLMAFATQASALTTLDDEFLGSVSSGTPANPTDEVNYINTLIGLASPSGPTVIDGQTYIRSDNDCGGAACPTAVVAGADKQEGNDTTIDLGDGWAYLLAKYDAEQGGSLIFYVGDLTGEVSVPSTFGTCGSAGCGLSHISLYNPGDNDVAEPMSLALLALGFLGLAFARRRVAA